MVWRRYASRKSLFHAYGMRYREYPAPVPVMGRRKPNTRVIAPFQRCRDARSMVKHYGMRYHDEYTPLPVMARRKRGVLLPPRHVGMQA